MTLTEFHQYSPWRREGTLRAVPWGRIAGVLFIVAGICVAGQGVYIRAKAELAQILLERAWAQTVLTGQPVKAWSWADTNPIARISFPTLKRSAIVLREAGGEALAFGPAHVAQSPLPGERGTSVIGGHRDTHFSYLRYLKRGDELEMTVPSGGTLKYRVTGAVIVHPKASGIFTRGSKRRLALVTCYPFDSVGRSSLRYVVFAEEVPAGEQVR